MKKNGVKNKQDYLTPGGKTFINRRQKFVTERETSKNLRPVPVISQWSADSYYIRGQRRRHITFVPFKGRSKHKNSLSIDIILREKLVFHQNLKRPKHDFRSANENKYNKNLFAAQRATDQAQNTCKNF